MAMYRVILTLAAILQLASCNTPAFASELTATDVRELLASVGVSPGTSKKLANGLGIQMLTSVDVKKVGNGEFIITVRVKRMGD